MGSQQDKDYYALLGIDRSASVDQIRVAFHAFARTHHPDNHGAEAGDERAEAAALYRLGSEAYRVLLDSGKRALYDQGLKEGHLRFDPQRAERAERRRSRGGQTIVSSPRARTFYATARRAISNGQWQQAALNLKLALQHDPQNEDLQAELERVQEQMKNN